MAVEACGHTALMGNICCDCGVLLREEDLPKTEAVSMLHSVPDLKISRGVSALCAFEGYSTLKFLLHCLQVTYH